MPQRPDRPDESAEDDRHRRAAVLFLLVFLLVLAGTIQPLARDLRAGSGELTVTVTDQDGNTISGERVQVLDPETGEVLFAGTTDDSGTLEATIDQGQYDIRVGDETKSVNLGDDADVDFSIDTSPPEARRSFRRLPVFSPPVTPRTATYAGPVGALDPGWTR